MLELFILLQVSPKEINTLIICVTLVFLIAPVSLLLYAANYNRRKVHHLEEKKIMQLRFETELVKTQLEVREQTLQTVGADLHDNIGQLLSLVALTLNSVNLAEEGKAAKKIDTAAGLTSRCIQEMRMLGKLLQGEHLVAAGLEQAIRQELEWVVKAGQLKAEFSCSGQPAAPISGDRELFVFRIVQEILSNCIKHAHATHMTINMVYDIALIQLEITDDGIGFEESLPSRPSGLGLYNIRRRAEMIGADVQIKSTPGTGTHFLLIIPYSI